MKKPKFRVGQVVVGTHNRDYMTRIKFISRDGNRFIYTDSEGDHWRASDLRPLNSKERGPAPVESEKGE